MFIKQLKVWREEKKKLQEQLDSIPLLPANQNESGVRGSDVSEPTAKLALKRLEIQDQIDDIERCEKVYDIAKARLTPDELEILQIFFEPKKPIWKAIDDYSGGNYVCRGIVYKRRRLLLEKLGRIIGGYFEQ
ncbi:MAG: hypothetical protein LIR46_00590 [Bacteroidota bacterium]|nr:hypothetical protein [Bacteroidota bacterium]